MSPVTKQWPHQFQDWCRVPRMFPQLFRFLHVMVVSVCSSGIVAVLLGLVVVVCNVECVGDPFRVTMSVARRRQG